MPTVHPSRVKPEEACRRCEIPEETIGETTGEKEASPVAFFGLGQDRFAATLETALAIKDPFYNIAAVGVAGTESLAFMRETVSQTVKKIQKDNLRGFPPANDWCYVFNFANQRSPVALPFKKGKGKVFRQKIETACATLQEKMSVAVQSETIESVMAAMRREIEKWRIVENQMLGREAAARGFLYFMLPNNPFGGFGPGSKSPRAEGETLKLMAPDEEQALSEPEINQFQEKNEELSALRRKSVEEFNARATALNQQAKALLEKAVQETIDEVFDALGMGDVGESSALGAYLSGLKDYSFANYEIFVKDDAKEKEKNDIASAMRENKDPFLPWKVNVFIDNSATEGIIPICARHIPTIEDFVGKMEYVHMLGVSYTDHTRIRPGVAAEANGGVLVVDAHDLLVVPGLWEVVKKYIRTQTLSLETRMSLMGYDAEQMHPLPIPFRTRVVLFGERWLMDLLANVDMEFRALFRARAEMKPFVERSPEQIAAYARRLQEETDRQVARSLSREGLARLIEYAGRIVQSQERLSTDFDALRTILSEAALNAKRGNAPEITDAHVAKAIKDRIWRADFYHTYLQERIGDQTYLVSVTGAKTGQINGLVITEQNDIMFGFPSRITAVASMGQPGFVNIHRAAKLAGTTLTKADETMRGLLEKTFAQDFPLSCRITFAFEQTYGPIDGDSASLAEYLVMLSSISGLPLRQDIAITGSANIHGDVQPIGGVNEKIEGFFDICVLFGGLTGTQGVIIPWQNKRDLMLRDDVVAAIREERFSVFAVETMDAAVEILFGRAPEEVYEKTKEALRSYSDKARAYSHGASGGNA